MYPTLAPEFLDPNYELKDQDEAVLLASLAWSEARGEIAKVGYLGPLAVMNVAITRSEEWNKSLADVILQSAVVGTRRIWQFTCWSHDDPRTPYKEPDDPNYTALLRMRQNVRSGIYVACWHLAVGLLNGFLNDDPSKNSTHYYNPAVASPNWGRGHIHWDERAVVGNHVFGRAA